MARYFDVHPLDPQPRAIGQVVAIVRGGGLIAYPTDSCFALGCQLGNADGIDRIRTIRQLDDRHHFTLVCHDFAQLGQFVHLSNVVFRAIKASTPGSYTFILQATKEVPRRLWHPRKKTVGVRIPDHAVARALLAQLAARGREGSAVARYAVVVGLAVRATRGIPARAAAGGPPVRADAHGVVAHRHRPPSSEGPVGVRGYGLDATRALCNFLGPVGG